MKLKTILSVIIANDVRTYFLVYLLHFPNQYNHLKEEILKTRYLTLGSNLNSKSLGEKHVNSENMFCIQCH